MVPSLALASSSYSMNLTKIRLGKHCGQKSYLERLDIAAGGLDSFPSHLQANLVTLKISMQEFPEEQLRLVEAALKRHNRPNAQSSPKIS